MPPAWMRMNDQVDSIRILKDGSLDLSDEMLGELDVVVGLKARPSSSPEPEPSTRMNSENCQVCDLKLVRRDSNDSSRDLET